MESKFSGDMRAAGGLMNGKLFIKVCCLLLGIKSYLISTQVVGAWTILRHMDGQ